LRAKKLLASKEMILQIIQEALRDYLGGPKPTLALPAKEWTQACGAERPFGFNRGGGCGGSANYKLRLLVKKRRDREIIPGPAAV